MSYEALSGVTNGRAMVQNNTKSLHIVYNLGTPVTVGINNEPNINNILPAGASLTVNFKTKKQGTFDIMSLMPLQALAVLEGLNGDNYSFIRADAVAPTFNLDIDAVPPTVTAVTGTIDSPNIDIIGIAFTVDLFEKGRIFSNGDNMEIVVSGMPVGDTISVYVSDFPYSFEEAKPYRFRTQTVLASNDYQVDFKGKILFPNDASKVAFVQMEGNTLVQWDLIDFFTNPSDIWVTNKNTYRTSNYLALDTMPLKSVKFKAAGTDFNFYYKDRF